MPRVKQPRPTDAMLAVPRQLQDRPGRWKLVMRRQRRRLRPALFCLAVLAIGLAAAGAVRGLGHGASFREQLGNVSGRLGLRVTAIEVEGRQKTPEPLVRAALGVHKGDAILTYSLAEARTRLETINWVQSATLERRLPGTIVVKLVERRPFAVWQTEGRFVLIDRDGNVVTDSDVAAFSGQLPLVVGVGAPQAAAALIDVLATQPALQARMTAAVRVGERRWNLRMDNGVDVMLPEGEEKRALARLAELQASHALLDRPLQVVDMRLPDRLVVRPVADKPEPPARPAPSTPRKT
jgi:cell division protein FtsQ